MRGQGSNPRLLIVAESLGVGGTESHFLRTLPPLSERGFDVTVFCLTGEGTRAGEARARGIEVVGPKSTETAGAGSRSPLHLVSAAGRLYALMRRLRPDIVHFYLPGPYLVGAPVAIAARAPVKITSRRSLSLYQRNWPLAGRVERRLHAAMDAAIGNSQAVVRELIGEGVEPEKARLIYNGIEGPLSLPDRAEARAALRLDSNCLVGAIVANLIPYKGHRDLIEALPLVAAKLQTPFVILAAGRDQGIRAELEALAAERGAAGRIRFLGEHQDISTLLAAADFGLLASHEEGFSNVVLEGMAAGLPMIVTNVGGNPEAVLDGETGLVVPPRDPGAIAQAILRLAADPALRTRLGEEGRARVEQKFSLRQCVDAHAALYFELLERRKKAAGAASS